MSEQATLYSALGNPTRLAAIRALSGRELSVTQLRAEVAEQLGYSVTQSAFSQHLKTLREANLLRVRRDAQFIHYSLNDELVGSMAEELTSIATAA